MKNTLRQKSLEKRKTLNCEDLSRGIIKNLLLLDEYKNSSKVIIYYPLKYEPDIRYLFNDKTKNFYLPRVNGNILDICPISDFNSLKKGSFNILEPETDAVSDYSKMDAAIIPSCAADVSGYRLGWGKGYYDRFLPLLPGSCAKIILAYSDLVYKTVYPDEHDFKCSIIVTDKEILRI